MEKIGGQKLLYLKKQTSVIYILLKRYISAFLYSIDNSLYRVHTVIIVADRNSFGNLSRKCPSRPYCHLFISLTYT